MIEIVTKSKDTYLYNEETGDIVKNGTLLSGLQAEPIFSGSEFAGIHLIGNYLIISRNGNINPVSKTENL